MQYKFIALCFFSWENYMAHCTQTRAHTQTHMQMHFYELIIFVGSQFHAIKIVGTFAENSSVGEIWLILYYFVVE